MLDFREEICIPDQCDFDRFNVASRFLCVRQKLKKIRVIDDREWRRKCADKVLLSKSIHGIFDPDTAITLAKRRSRQAHMADSAVCCRGRKTGHVEQGAATNRSKIRMTGQTVLLDKGVQLFDWREAVFQRLATW